MLDLENIFRPLLDRMRYGVTMGGAQHQGLKSQHIQSSLRHLAL